MALSNKSEYILQPLPSKKTKQTYEQDEANH